MAAGLPKVSIPRASGGGRKAPSDLDSEVTWQHSLYTVLVTVARTSPDSSKKRSRPSLSRGKWY